MPYKGIGSGLGHLGSGGVRAVWGVSGRVAVGRVV